MIPDKPSNCRNKAAKLLSLRAYSGTELYRKLIDKGEKPEEAAEAVSWLLGLGLLDDLEYAKTVVRHYAKKGYGEAKIKSELYGRFVPREFWEEALYELPEQNEAIDKLVCAKLGYADLRSVKPDRTELKKAADSLRRRGFSWDEINSALRRYMEGIE